MELKKGTLLQGGKYKIEQTLGQGTFGITYLAVAKFSTTGNLGAMEVVAKVAIKEFFMSDFNGRKEDGSTVDGSTGSIYTNYRRRFKKEAENLSKLHHPNIVKIFDVFEENDTTYYVMEYLNDVNLNKYIKINNGLAEKECIALTEEIGDALQYMHDSYMLHLDLKPGNIMMRGNEPVLIDFGLSKQFTPDGEPGSSTKIGQGTPGYAPLEQQHYTGHHGKGLPYSMDVYALGGTMFKMLTGHTPPDASSIFNDGFPRAELEAHNVSERMIDIVEKAMSPGKNDRYKTINRLLHAIDPERKIPARQPEPKPVSAPETQGGAVVSAEKRANKDEAELVQIVSHGSRRPATPDGAPRGGSHPSAPGGNKANDKDKATSARNGAAAKPHANNQPGQHAGANDIVITHPRDKGDTRHNTDGEKHSPLIRMTDTLADFFAKIWNPVATPLVSLFVWALAIYVFPDSDSKYWDMAFKALSVSVVLVNLCSFVCVKSGNQRLRRTSAVVALLSVIVYCVVVLMCFFPREFRSILKYLIRNNLIP